MNNLFCLLLPAILFLGACNHVQPGAKNAADDAIPVKVLLLQPRNGVASIAASGQFTTDDETFLSFKTGGVIDRIFVKEGDAASKGQLLAVLKLTEIDAQVEQANLAMEKANRDFLRMTSLYKDSVATLEQLQNSKTLLDISRQQLDEAKFNRSFSEIRAPRAGFILHKMANEGQQVASGVPVFQTNGAGSVSWLLRVGLSDVQWSAVHINDKAVLATDGGNVRNFDGVVIRKSQGVDPATGLFMVDIKVAGKSEGIGSGMFGKAVIEPSVNKPASTGNSWEIPYEALLDADGSMGFVFVADGNSVTKTKVVIAGMEQDKVIITDGLQNAKAIVTSGNAYLTDKSSIRIIKNE
jgi:RND family efflux transporter MFP subunit